MSWCVPGDRGGSPGLISVSGSENYRSALSVPELSVENIKMGESAVVSLHRRNVWLRVSGLFVTGEIVISLPKLIFSLAGLFLAGDLEGVDASEYKYTYEHNTCQKTHEEYTQDGHSDHLLSA